jgi:hypothetical protein
VQSVTNATYTAVPQSFGLASQVTLSGSTVAQVTPYAVVYLAPDTNGNLQAFQVPLTDTASTPSAAQVGLIASAPWTNTTICNSKTAARNLFQPATGFGIVQYAVSPNTCTSGEQTVLINLSDSSTTAAATVPVALTDFGDLYLSSGALYGVVAVDPSTHQLNLYPASTSGGPVNFSSPTMLLANVQSASHLILSVNRSGQVMSGGSVEYAQVTFTTSNTPDELLRIDTSGSAPLAAFQFGQGGTGTITTDSAWRDNTNLYFTVTATNGLSTVCNLYQTPIAAGGLTKQIGTIALSQAGACAIQDTDGTSLVVNAQGAGGDTLESFAVGGASTQTPTQLLQGSAGEIFQAAMDYATGNLFVNELAISGSTKTYTGLVLHPSGATPATPIAGPTVGTAYEPIWNNASYQSTNWLVFTGVPTDGTFGGAKLGFVPTATPSQAPTAVTCPLCAGGPTYQVPAGAVAGAAPFTSTVAIGAVLYSGGSSPDLGLILNPQSAQLVQLSVTNESLTPF